MGPRAEEQWFSSRCSLSLVTARGRAYASWRVAAADACPQQHISLQSEGDAHPTSPSSTLQHPRGANRLGYSLLRHAWHCALRQHHGKKHKPRPTEVLLSAWVQAFVEDVHVLYVCVCMLQ